MHYISIQLHSLPNDTHPLDLPINWPGTRSPTTNRHCNTLNHPPTRITTHSRNRWPKSTTHPPTHSPNYLPPPIHAHPPTLNHSPTHSSTHQLTDTPSHLYIRTTHLPTRIQSPSFTHLTHPTIHPSTHSHPLTNSPTQPPTHSHPQTTHVHSHTYSPSRPFTHRLSSTHIAIFTYPLTQTFTDKDPTTYSHHSHPQIIDAPTCFLKPHSPFHQSPTHLPTYALTILSSDLPPPTHPLNHTDPLNHSHYLSLAHSSSHIAA